ncbi:MAG: hypothetical protein IPK75_20365 [Acidobacteria bacterium]|nr:hypothetical protein [Acidobacteriota bacterium]
MKNEITPTYTHQHRDVIDLYEALGHPARDIRAGAVYLWHDNPEGRPIQEGRDIGQVRTWLGNSGTIATGAFRLYCELYPGEFAWQDGELCRVAIELIGRSLNGDKRARAILAAGHKAVDRYAALVNAIERDEEWSL